MRHFIAVLSIVLCGVLRTPYSDAAEGAPTFGQEQLEQMLAPIALYPDSLLSQVLMASTYPLEVVEAARWSASHKDLSGDAAVKAAEQERWDPSVKSLVAFPTVLSMMNDKLDWTQQLGDAFLAQQSDVMSTVQVLRKRAQDAGQLKTTEQQKVTTQAQTIIIEPAQPQVVYVPAYNPTVVYGSWPYPAYPPVYFPPPPGYVFGGAIAAGIGFGIGIAVTDAMFGDCDWHHGSVNINVNRYNNINVNNRTNINNVNRTTNTWQHDASHRRGVAYRDTATQSRYADASRARSTNDVNARRDYRGFDSKSTASGATRPDAGGTPNQRVAAANTSNRSSSERSRSSNPVSGASSALSAAPNRSIEHNAASRGRSSTSGMQYERRGGTGGSRGGGGGSFARRR